MQPADEETFVLRTDSSGKVVAMSERAQELMGAELVGRPCDLVVRGVGTKGETVCRAGCAAELASGELPSLPTRDTKVRDRRVHLRCVRVGEETVVIAQAAKTADSTEQLTPREKEVMGFVARGMSSSQIAGELGITAATVRTHVEHARGRLGARTRAEAVIRAINTGQLSISP